jgi:hypothetical protein
MGGASFEVTPSLLAAKHRAAPLFAFFDNSLGTKIALL